MSDTMRRLAVLLVLILAACGGNPSTEGETIQPALPTSTTGQRPAETQVQVEPEPVDTQAPVESEAPVENAATAEPGEANPTEVVSPSDGIDACTLVTREEAEAALGSPVGEPVQENLPPIYSCSYETEGFDEVSVTVVVYDDVMQAEGSYQMAIDFNDYEEVDGIGDRAYRSYPFFDINVLTGRYELSVDVIDIGEEEEQYQKARQLAEVALTRMP